MPFKGKSTNENLEKACGGGGGGGGGGGAAVEGEDAEEELEEVKDGKVPTAFGCAYSWQDAASSDLPHRPTSLRFLSSTFEQYMPWSCFVVHD